MTEVHDSNQGKEIEIKLKDEIFSILFTPVRDTNYVNLYGLNITDRKRAEEEIRKNQKMLSEAENLAHIGSFEWNILEDKVTWSDELYRIFGLDQEKFDASFEGFLDRIHPESRQKVKKTIEEVCREGKSFSAEERIVRPDGTIRVLFSKGGTIKDGGGRIVKLVGTCQDITERKRAEEALQKAYGELEQKVEERTRALRQKQAQLVQSEKMASLGQLVAGVAHEINTPLGALKSNVDLFMRSVQRVESILSDPKMPSQVCKHPKLAKLFENIEKLNAVNKTAADRIVTIVNSLRKFARLDETELDEVDLHEGIENTLTLVRHELKNRIEVCKDYGKTPRVSCYPNRLNQVFMNLLVNASHAIQGQGKIFIKTRFKDNSVVVEIRDTGMGISKENLKRIFDPGFTTKGFGVGTGLGLSIVYQIVEDHRGRIEVESEVGKGTTFRLILPVR